MIEIDGSYGEGGGQVLRTALTLSALTSRPTRIRRIRAGRRNPGLAPQHLTGVLALAAVCGAEVRGAAIGSTEVEFHPRCAPCAGEYTFDVSDAARGGSAGSVTLIFQTLLLPLALADGTSRLTLRGGTHVAWSPPYHYLAHVYLPTLARMGIRAETQLDAWGFYPVGGGQMSAAVSGQSSAVSRQPSAVSRQPSGDNQQSAIRNQQSPINNLQLTDRGALKRVWGLAVAANLPAHIPQRIANRARNVLAQAGLSAEVRTARERGAGPGAGLFLFAEYEHAVAGFSALGEKGKPSERVADEACRDLLAHRTSGQAVDMHLADQLLLPMALARGRSALQTCRITQHLLTNAHIIRQFLPIRIEVEGGEGSPGCVIIEAV